jgi:hypothetical protein
MSKLQSRVARAAAAVALACVAQAGNAAVLNFDDLTSTTLPDWFTADYHGFRFGTNNTATTAWFFTDEVSPNYGASSGNQYVSTDFNLYSGAPFEATQGITSAVDFVFNGAYFSGFDQIRYQLYNNGVLVHTSADSALLDATPRFVTSGYNGLVDEIVILGTQGLYAMDDFTYNVPEPTSLALVLLAGVAGALTLRRKG